MRATESLDAIIAALGAILISAPPRERQRLAQAIEQFAIRSNEAALARSTQWDIKIKYRPTGRHRHRLIAAPHINGKTRRRKYGEQGNKTQRGSGHNGSPEEH